MKAITLLLLSAAAPICSYAERESLERVAEDHPEQKYFLFPHSNSPTPEKGLKLLIVLPGGDGSATFRPFIRNLAGNATGEDWIVAQLVSVKWTSHQQMIWPTEMSEAKDMEFTTEEFIKAVIDDVRKETRIDPDHIYTLSWSSGGPAAYAASLSLDEIAGSFVAMSVFRPDQLPRLSKAKGHRYFIYHSAEDKVCPFRMAKEAQAELTDAGAVVKFQSYAGGHGWFGDVFGNIRAGLEWLASGE